MSRDTSSIQQLPIRIVGRIEPRPDGQGIDASDWQFGAPWLPEGSEVPITDGNLGGWTANELHKIAHGAPCDCLIGLAHAEQQEGQ